MEVKNGIIIDGVLHELVKSNREDCLGCSLFDLCREEFGRSCICWIDIASTSEIDNVEFRNRGKVRIEEEK